MDCVSKTVAGRRRARASTGGRKLRGVRGVQPGFRGQAQGVGRWGRVGVGAGPGSRGQGGPTPAHAHSRPLVPPTPELTMGAGAALPAVPADAGEGVPTAHAGTPVHTGVGQAAAVLGCKGVREGEQKEKEELSPEPGRGPHPRPRPTRHRHAPAPHRQCTCCPSSPGRRRSGRRPRCRSTCRRCCTCRRRTGTHLQAHGHSEAARSSGRHPGRHAPRVAGRGGHSREWQVLPFQPSSHTQ